MGFLGFTLKLVSFLVLAFAVFVGLLLNGTLHSVGISEMMPPFFVGFFPGA